MRVNMFVKLLTMPLPLLLSTVVYGQHAPTPPYSKPYSKPAPTPDPAPSTPTFIAETSAECVSGQKKCDWNALNEHTKCSNKIYPSLIDLNRLRDERDIACGSPPHKSDKCVYAQTASEEAMRQHTRGSDQCADLYIEATAACHRQKTDCDTKIFLKQKYIWELN